MSGHGKYRLRLGGIADREGGKEKKSMSREERFVEEGESSLFFKSGKLGFWAARWGKLSEGLCQMVQGVGSTTGSYPQLKGRLVSGHEGRGWARRRR
jgi:hypothetical protein